MMNVRFVLLALLPLLCLGSGSTWKPQDPLTNPGFVHFYNNEFDEAVTYFEKDVRAQPHNPEAYNHLAQGILYRELFRNGALESELVTGANPFLRRPKMNISAEDKTRFMECISKAISLSESLLKTDPRDIHALYCLAVAHGFRANYLFLVEKSWMDSLRSATTGRKTEQKILEIDPSFVDAHLGLGVHDYIVGSLPFYMRAFGFLAGIHGDRDDGIQEIEMVNRNGILSRYDAEILLAAIYRRERMPQRAIPLLKDAAARFPRNYLFRFEQVQMYSDLGDKESALRILAELEDLRRTGAPGYRNIAPEKIEYFKGNLLFWYGDLDPALTSLQQVVQKSQELDLNTVVMAWLRLGQVYDLKGERSEAIKAYRQTMGAAPESEAAAEAKGYIANPYKRKRKSS
jgi:tetratricopeptide (TPR) repeat protein